MIKILNWQNEGKIDVSFKTFTFNGGEEQVTIEQRDTFSTYYVINAEIESSKDLMVIFLITDALRRMGATHIDLMCPYFPYARQDRVMQSGEALSLKVVANLINAQKYDKVVICDAHSDVAPALIDNVVNISQSIIVFEYLKNGFFTNDNCVLVAPDAGAIKKVIKLSEKTGIEMVRADKHRDVKTGRITETVVYSEHIGDKNFFIVDDICDGGRTFVELAHKLCPLTNGKVYLYVTHGIFANGLKVFEGKIDGVFCPYPFSNISHEGYTGEFIS